MDSSSDDGIETTERIPGQDGELLTGEFRGQQPAGNPAGTYEGEEVSWRHAIGLRQDQQRQNDTEARRQRIAEEGRTPEESRDHARFLRIDQRTQRNERGEGAELLYSSDDLAPSDNDTYSGHET